MIRIGILGYGNLGRGVECAVRQNDDMELTAVFTRRSPESVQILTKNTPVYSIQDILQHTQEIDVLIICGGSATDLPVQTPEYAKYFNVVDSFDTHASIPQHFENVDKAAKESGKIGMISVGWDPGMFSLNRVYANAILPDGKDYTFWGKGVSQGHSDAIRRVDGVIDARQYTIPVPASLEAVETAVHRNYQRVKNIRENAMLSPARVRIKAGSKKRSKKCQTISLTMIQRYTLSPKKSWTNTTAAFHTAVL